MNRARIFLGKVKRRLIRILYSILPAADVTRLTSLSQVKAKIRRIPIPLAEGSIRGHLRPDEQRALYALGAMAESPLLEIGPFLGLSTVCLAKGILAGGTPKEFVTCELNPTLANYRELPDGQIAFYYPPESDITMGSCSREVFETKIKPDVDQPGGIVGQLRKNLQQFEVDKLVQIATGDFRSALPEQKFRFIFADTMHEPSEIRRNAPDLLKFVMDGTLLACHDTTPENLAELSRYFQFTDSMQIDTLFVGIVKLR